MWHRGEAMHQRAKLGVTAAVTAEQKNGRRRHGGAVRLLHLFALAYNLANVLRSLALPDAVAQWSLTTLREKLVEVGARIVRHGRYVVF